MTPRQQETARRIADSALERGQGPTREEARREFGLRDGQLTDTVIDEAARLYVAGTERRVA
ncbi:hypothetical protein [Rhizobium halophytocola]|uniref:Antitoxin VbhA domain-containing protein n=1 Tax=Rhizobium halophytocola TaxID=735519 RepID=A0ABS4E2I9_9HYPH|nr:hypothetical protein [Rhizobium halophytocola]MBP1852144.1 hypothetical protein [Rhizobium halophytocola]